MLIIYIYIYIYILLLLCNSIKKIYILLLLCNSIKKQYFYLKIIIYRIYSNANHALHPAAQYIHFCFFLSLFHFTCIFSLKSKNPKTTVTNFFTGFRVQEPEKHKSPKCCLKNAKIRNQSSQVA
jgi:hypothetical protein